MIENNESFRKKCFTLDAYTYNSKKDRTKVYKCFKKNLKTNV